MMTVPSGETEVKTIAINMTLYVVFPIKNTMINNYIFLPSFSAVPRTFEERAFAM